MLLIWAACFLVCQKLLLRIHRSQWVRNCAFSADGRSLFSTWTDDNLWVSDAATGERQHVIKLEDPDRPDTYQSAWSMHLSDDGARLVTLSYYQPKKTDGPRYEETLITGWDPATRKQVFQRRRPGTGSSIAISSDARILAAPSRRMSRIGRTCSVPTDACAYHVPLVPCLANTSVSRCV